MKTVTIYTDGACSGNPGPGGWGAILQYGKAEKELSGSEPSTTNNRMELLGVITALETLKEPCSVDLYSDSKYVVDGITKGWAKGWRARGWVKSDKKPAKNPELWGRLLDLLDKHEVRFHWVKGHADNPYNNRCDELAVGNAAAFRCTLTVAKLQFRRQAGTDRGPFQSRPKVPIQKLSPSRSVKTEILAPGFYEFAKQILFYARYSANWMERQEYPLFRQTEHLLHIL